MAVGKTGDGNPLKEDAQLKLLLKSLDSLHTQRDFRRWKVSFLERFEEYLDADAIEQAEDRYHSFTLSLGKTSRLVKRLYTMLQKGDLVPPNPENGEDGRITVMARKCLTDLHFQIEEIIDHLTGMLPATKMEEIDLGYSKYHLGAVLIRDGFVEYDRLVICDEIMQHMRTQALQLVADKVLLDQLEYYHDRLQMFCDVMADLGLYEAMVKCRQLLYLDDSDDDEEEEGSGSESSDKEAYVPPLPLPSTTVRTTPREPPTPVECTMLEAEPENSNNDKPTSPVISVTGSTPAPPIIEKPPSKTKATALPKAKKAPSAPSPAGGLYSRKRDDDDSDSAVDGPVSIHSNQSNDSAAITETSYFNTNPVWEQKKGENNKAYYNLNTYYHGNPTDFLIARKLRNQQKEQDGENNDSDGFKKEPTSSTKNELLAGPKKHLKMDPLTAPKTESMQQTRTNMNDLSFSPGKHIKKEVNNKDSKTDKRKEHKKEKEKAVQPLPESYPPPSPTKRKESPHHSKKKKSESAVIPPSISIPIDDDDSEDEKNSSFLPNAFGGQGSKKNRNIKGDDVEALGMESAHGTALMSLPKIHRLPRGTSFDNATSDGDASTSASPLHRQRRRMKANSDEASDGPPEWDAVLGPTDGTGRPEMHRGMSILSLNPDGKSDDDDSTLRKGSLLTPKMSALAPQEEIDEKEEEEDNAFIPLTPSQIKAKEQKASGTFAPKSNKKEKEEEGSDRTSPTVSSTMEDDHPDKSSGTRSKSFKKPFVKRSDNRENNLMTPLRSKNAPPDEICFSDETAGKSSLRKHPKPNHSRDKHAFDIDAGNPAHHKHHPSHYGGHPRSPKKDGKGSEPNEEDLAMETTMNESSADHEGLRDFSKPKRSPSGLKDYSRKTDGEKGAPSHTKSGLQDYSKRGKRSINISNSAMATEDALTKDKHHITDLEGKSTNNEMVRKPKKELKISMSSKEPALSIPPPEKEPPKQQTKEKKEKKEKRKEKKTSRDKRETPLTEDEKVLMRKKCYMWYARMGQPDRENMKRRVAALPPHCNIYVEDVDLLPWICFGTVLSVKAMNELFMGDDAE